MTRKCRRKAKTKKRELMLRWVRLLSIKISPSLSANDEAGLFAHETKHPLSHHAHSILPHVLHQETHEGELSSPSRTDGEASSDVSPDSSPTALRPPTAVLQPRSSLAPTGSGEHLRDGWTAALESLPLPAITALLSSLACTHSLCWSVCPIQLVCI